MAQCCGIISRAMVFSINCTAQAQALLLRYAHMYVSPFVCSHHTALLPPSHIHVPPFEHSIFSIVFSLFSDIKLPHCLSSLPPTLTQCFHPYHHSLTHHSLTTPLLLIPFIHHHTISLLFTVIAAHAHCPLLTLTAHCRSHTLTATHCCSCSPHNLTTAHACCCSPLTIGHHCCSFSLLPLMLTFTHTHTCQYPLSSGCHHHASTTPLSVTNTLSFVHWQHSFLCSPSSTAACQHHSVSTLHQLHSASVSAHTILLPFLLSLHCTAPHHTHSTLSLVLCHHDHTLQCQLFSLHCSCLCLLCSPNISINTYILNPCTASTLSLHLSSLFSTTSSLLLFTDTISTCFSNLSIVLMLLMLASTMTLLSPLLTVKTLLLMLTARSLLLLQLLKGMFMLTTAQHCLPYVHTY